MGPRGLAISRGWWWLPRGAGPCLCSGSCHSDKQRLSVQFQHHSLQRRGGPRVRVHVASIEGLPGETHAERKYVTQKVGDTEGNSGAGVGTVESAAFPLCTPGPRSLSLTLVGRCWLRKEVMVMMMVTMAANTRRTRCCAKHFIYIILLNYHDHMTECSTGALLSTLHIQIVYSHNTPVR